MATANAVLLKQRQEQWINDIHKRTNSEQQRKLWKRKTDVLASRANLRYERANLLAEQAEQRIDDRLREKKNVDQRDRIDKGVAAILSFGNYDGARPNRDLNTINHDSSHGVHGQGKVAFGMTTLGPPPGGKLPGNFAKTDRVGGGGGAFVS